jgi:hypothetical protein
MRHSGENSEFCHARVDFARASAAGAQCSARLAVPTAKVGDKYWIAFCMYRTWFPGTESRYAAMRAQSSLCMTRKCVIVLLLSNGKLVVFVVMLGAIPLARYTVFLYFKQVRFVRRSLATRSNTQNPTFSNCLHVGYSAGLQIIKPGVG